MHPLATEAQRIKLIQQRTPTLHSAGSHRQASAPRLPNQHLSRPRADCQAIRAATYPFCHRFQRLAAPAPIYPQRTVIALLVTQVYLRSVQPQLRYLAPTAVLRRQYTALSPRAVTAAHCQARPLRRHPVIAAAMCRLAWVPPAISAAPSPRPQATRLHLYLPAATCQHCTATVLQATPACMRLCHTAPMLWEPHPLVQRTSRTPQMHQQRQALHLRRQMAQHAVTSGPSWLASIPGTRLVSMWQSPQ